MFRRRVPFAGMFQEGRGGGTCPVYEVGKTVLIFAVFARTTKKIGSRDLSLNPLKTSTFCGNVQLCFLCGSQHKARLVLYTVLTYRFL
jgi:hypothetical protein